MEEGTEKNRRVGLRRDGILRVSGRTAAEGVTMPGVGTVLLLQRDMVDEHERLHIDRTSYGGRAAEATATASAVHPRGQPGAGGRQLFGSRIFGSEQLDEIDRRIERQLAAIEAGIDPVLVSERIHALKGEREDAQAALSHLEGGRRDSMAVDPEDAAAILAALPDLGKALANADPEQRRALFDPFRLRVEIDRNNW
jgi:hypothetical protein